jgi:glycosyltransferase involved in cell wall biosynthesis
MKPLVSILIPAFNCQGWIGDSITSALGQTWPRKEIIVVDDGSTDRTLSIARRFASRHLCVASQVNQGAAAARNKAFSMCQGDYIQWLDADDLLSPDKVARQMEVAERCSDTRVLLSSAWGYFMYRPHHARFSSTALWCDLSPAEWMLRKWEQNLHMQTATWLVSRDLTEAAGPWDTRLLGDDDGEYFCRVLLGSVGVRFVPDAKVFYRITASGRLSYIGGSRKKIEAMALGMQLQIGYLRAVADDERVRAAGVSYLQTWLHHFYPERLDMVDELKRVAATLGGQLETPQLTWKYAWIANLLGWTAAKGAQLRYNRCKTSVLRSWDKALLLAEERLHLSSSARPLP